MGTLGKLRAVAGTFARAKARRTANQFLAGTADCQRTQHDTLRRILRLNADSRFSSTHGLDRVHDVSEFQSALPVSDYEFFRPWIDDVKLGDHQALLGSRNELLMFALTSGTTSQAKYVPITRQFLVDYKRGWNAWGIRAFDDHFPINWKNIVQLSSDYDRYRTPGGTPCGNISGLVAAMQSPIVRLMYTVPATVAKIDDSRAKYYANLRIAVADPDVGMLTTANPSTLVHLARLANEHAESLIRDIHDGTLSSEFDVPPHVRRKLRRYLKRNPARARALDRIRERNGSFYPRDFWSELELLAVWCGGSAAWYLDQVHELYGDVPVRDHGLSASEGRMTIPLDDGTPAGVLDVASHFFEFVPEEEYESADPTVLEAHQLEEGRHYFILLTTPSGLYRYDIHDVVRCNGFYGTAPVLEFLHKGAHIANLTGEKLCESQVVNAVRHALNGEASSVGEFTVSPVWDDPPHYQLLLERGESLTPPRTRQIAADVDHQLQHLNVEYAEKRTTGRLAPLRTVCLPPGTWKRFARQRQRSFGASVEQYKHPYLVPHLDFTEHLSALGEDHPTPPAHSPHSPPHTPTRPRKSKPRVSH